MQPTGIQDLNEMDLWSRNDRPCDAVNEIGGSSKNHLPLRLWEIEYFFKCPVIGTCLDITEQKQILKKTGVSLKKKSHFEIHETLVGSSESENRISRKIDCLLNRKFKKEITAFYNLKEDDFIELWKNHFKDGHIESVLWVTAIRPDLSEKVRKAIFGDIHMGMHLNAGQNREVRQYLARQQEENRRLTQRLKEAIGTRRDIIKQNEKLEKELSESHNTSSLLEKKSQELELELLELLEFSLVARLRTENQQLQANLRKLQGEVKDFQQQLDALQGQNSRLLSKLDKQRNLNGHLRTEMERTTAQIFSLDQCDETCPSFDLCQKRILIVGGITKMEALYRQLIEENGGIFEYHDGYMKGGIKGLENQVRRADMVLCPTNCNSHTACLAVKKMGKKYGTPIQMLAGSSLTSISNTLMEHHKHANIQ